MAELRTPYSLQGARAYIQAFTAEAFPGGTLVTITSDINNQAMQQSAMAIGLGLPVIVGAGAASIIIPSWIAAGVATAIALGIGWYVRCIRRWLADEFDRDVRELARILDPRREYQAPPA